MAGAQQQQPQGDHSLGPLWIAAGVCLLFATIWYFLKSQIVAFILGVRLLEINLISLFTNALQPLATTIRHFSPADYGSVDLNQIINVSNAVGSYLSYPVAAILATLAIVLYASNPTLRFKKTYNMKALAELEKENWPQITPVVKLDLVSEDIDKGPWSMALSPMQFAKKYQLLREEQPTENAAYIGKQRIIAVVIRERAQSIFALQLGGYWTSPDNLKIHTKAIFAACAARIAGDREGAANLLAQIARSSATGKLDFSGTDALLKKHVNHKVVVKVMQSHAYIFTVMASMLATARNDGVFSTADFLWLKPVDRQLWYVLNNVGRQTAFPEIAGFYSHWLAELQLGYRLYVPVVDEAVNALDKAIQDIIYIPDEVE